MNIAETIERIEPELIALRHELHAFPEIGLEVPRTQARVLKELHGLGLGITTGTASTSVTAVLRGTHPDRPETDAPVVLLRADMDGLAVHELTGVNFASQIDGAMHACGHDMHTTMLCGAAHVLAEIRHELCGDVVFMFQPGEEMHDGAAVMIREGVLDAAGRRADAAFALHVFAARIENNHFCSRSGAMMAAADGFSVTVRGRGGHGSAPHLSRDPVTVACEMVLALQTFVTRRFNIFDPIVIGVGSIHAGAAPNVIPETATFDASVRYWSEANHTLFRDGASKLVTSIAEAHDVTAEVTHTSGYPVTYTTPAETEFAGQTIASVFGSERFDYLVDPLSASEDFSRILAAVPGSFIGLGAAPKGVDPATAADNHSSYAQFDDAVLGSGTNLYVELARRRLSQLAAERTSLPTVQSV